MVCNPLVTGIDTSIGSGEGTRSPRSPTTRYTPRVETRGGVDQARSIRPAGQEPVSTGLVNIATPFMAWRGLHQPDIVGQSIVGERGGFILRKVSS